MMLPVAITAAVVLLLIVVLGVRIVPQQSAHVVERLGRFNGVLGPGLNVIVPFIDKLLETLLSPWLKVIESTIPVVALR